MGHGTKIGGTAYGVTGGRCLVGGTAYGLRGGTVLTGGTAHPIAFSKYAPVFADNTWADIIEACQTGAVPDTWVADGSCSKTMTIGGQDYQIDIIGKNHDVYFDDESTAPLTFQLHQVYNDSYTAENVLPYFSYIAYQNSTIRLEILPAILALMPEEVRAAVRNTRHSNPDFKEEITQYVLSDGLFLPTEYEILGEQVCGASGVFDKQYAYYQTPAHRIKYNLLGQPAAWLTASSAYAYEDVALDLANTWSEITETGGAAAADVRQPRCIAPAFCF